MNNESLFIFSHVHKSGGTSINHHIRTNYPRSARLHVQFDAEDSFFNMSSKSYQIVENVAQVDEYLNSLNSRQLDKIRIVFGHDVYNGIHEHFSYIPKYLTFLRHPVSRLVSYFNYSIETAIRTASSSRPDPLEWIGSFYEGDVLLNFQEWFEKVRSDRSHLDRHLPSYIDHFCKIFDVRDAGFKPSIDVAKNILSRFSFVGITECFEDFLFVYEQIGCKKLYRNQNLSRNNYLGGDDYSYISKYAVPFLQEDILLYEFAVGLNRDFKIENDKAYARSVASCTDRIDDWTWRKIDSDLDIINRSDLLNRI